MTAKQIVQSTASIFKSAWKRHQAILGLIVAAVFDARRVGVAVIGRHLLTRTVPKHAIKRVDRFLGNRRFDDRVARETLLRTVIGNRKRVLIPVDWTKVRKWPVLAASVVHRGRSVPVLWAVIDPKKLYKSQNAFENAFFAWLASALPKGTKAIVLLDRGFKRVELVRHLRRCGLSFVIRTGGNTHVHHAAYHGQAQNLISRRGQKRDLAGATLRKSRPVTVRLVGIWKRGQKEPWLLQTDLDEPLLYITAYYAKRFQIEETFRDGKDYRFGIFLGHLKMLRADRLERLLLVVALVHFLAMLVGGYARTIGLDRGFRANTVKHKATHSDFALGLFYITRIRCNRLTLLRIFYSQVVMEFWG